ncbi:exopolysaccharide biosynthesis polyprenyl glycosylphosphotransferase [Pimelobacter simplex]|uniref:exopolysaccharide biosynthesis polyprenyl glycosylphosphotransferase n=1 Tax=Nocardioides simplex TaxID=2045 RepID=UPI0021503A03|nr:exopolysaccharide biosynthesis polyprenyl glycosylphosphotransferase [Pimelobacter simplex]UUW90302.1 exopolysaccharide biosynthesis polyprenyl glycosylphosphotransferase [Pimelobacter simplex]UUW94132.1 exopolysaccharide biosynthesis polyprenyl glycosylphosphotransferase [Pimelobacter simplex]
MTVVEARLQALTTTGTRTAVRRIVRHRTGRLLIAGDAVAAVLVVFLATLAGGVHRGPDALLFVPIWLAAVATTGDYRLPGSLALRGHRLLLAALVLPTAALLTAEAIGYPLSALTVTTVCAGTATLGMAGRRLLPAGPSYRVVVVGGAAALPGLVDRLVRTHPHRFAVVGACVAAGAPPGLGDLPLGQGLSSCPDIVLAGDADAVLLAPDPAIDPAAVRRLRWRLEDAGLAVFVWAGLDISPAGRTRLDLDDDLPLLHLDAPRRMGPTHAVKRLLDRTLALLAVLLLTPLLLALVIAVRLDSPGPAFYRQVRVGRGDSRFTMWKLRTMHCDSDSPATLAALAAADHGSGPLFKIARDPRVTRLGYWLRRTSLDELPQLFNVVLGQMSLVGPRPALPAEVERYHPDVRHRLVMHPGITGLWQVSGRSDLSWEESVRLDQEYVDDWSLLLDLRIVVRTVGAVLRGRGAY